MTLLLEIIGAQAAQFAQGARALFVDTGGTIGRAADSDWNIPDPFISSRHARVHYRDGQYLLEDTSTNGVFVQARDNRLRKGELYLLQNGDRLFIDALEIRVTITDPREPLPDHPDPTELIAPGPATEALGGASLATAALQIASLTDPRGLARVDNPMTEPLLEPAGAVIDALMARRGEPLPLELDEPLLGRLDAAGPRPMLAAGPADDTEVLGPMRGTAGPRAEPPPPFDFAALLQAAGVPAAQVTPELAASVGRLLQVSVAGMLEALRSREHVKSEFGMNATRIKAVDNNPLKFSVNVEDALHNLFVKSNTAFLKPADAFEEAFREIRHHQLAMLAAMKSAFTAVLSEFEPRRLEDEFSRKRSGWSMLPAKARHWEAYGERFASLSDDPQNAFRDLFGQEFIEAYTEELRRLKRTEAEAARGR